LQHATDALASGWPSSGFPPKRKAAPLPGGNQAQAALTVALYRRLWLLLLDEPVATLDPIAPVRLHGECETAMTGNGVSVLLCARSSDPDDPSAQIDRRQGTT
jgi:ABC-type branched-subunit amino acid transport system ATPase component